MNEINRIACALRPHLNWHGARVNFLALFLVALFRVETVNLDKLASVFANRAQSASNYKRLQRFFRHFAIDSDEIARVVVNWSQILHSVVVYLECRSPHACPCRQGPRAD